MMVQRLFVALFGCSLLVACGGDGGKPLPAPAPGGTERPLTDPQDPQSNDQRPLPDSQRPAGNDQDPVSTELPGSNPGAGANTHGGAGNNEEPGPGGGKKCTRDGDQCAGCKGLCAACKCRAGAQAANCGAACN